MATYLMPPDPMRRHAGESIRALRPLGDDRYEPAFDPIDTALMARLFLEEGLVVKRTLEVYARKLVFHFSTKGRYQPTASAFQKKTKDTSKKHRIAILLSGSNHLLLPRIKKKDIWI